MLSAVQAPSGEVRPAGKFRAFAALEVLNQPGGHQPEHQGGVVEHVGLQVSGPALVHDFERRLGTAHARALDLDARVFLLEPIGDRTDDLVGDQAGVPDDRAFPARGSNERRVERRIRCLRRQGKEATERQGREHPSAMCLQHSVPPFPRCRHLCL